MDTFESNLEEIHEMSTIIRVCVIVIGVVMLLLLL